MAITVGCSSCGKQFGVPEKHAGKKIRCPDCGSAVQVGGGSPDQRNNPPGRQRVTAVAPPRSTTARQAGRATQPKKAAGISPLLIGGGIGVFLLLVAGGGLVGWKVLFSVDAVTPAVAEGTKSAEAKDLTPSDTVANAPPATQSDAAADGINTASVTPANVAPAEPAENRNTPAAGDFIDGDRVAWLTQAGQGFARIGDGWAYYGDAAAVPFVQANGNAIVTLPLVETMRNSRFVELFDPVSHVRIRIDTNTATAFQNDGTQHQISGGNWQSSTAIAQWRSSVASTDASEYVAAQISETDRLQDLISIVERNVVRVDVKTGDGEGNGSGFLLDASGRIVTNYHVVEGCTASSVVFKGQNGDSDMRLPVDGFLHVDSKKDIAIIQVTLPASFKRPGLRLAEELPGKGTSVVAFGAPLGLDFTASEGIVSGFRSAAELENTLGLTGSAGNWIQTTAPISPGNSGGPLVDKSGRVVAINTMTLTIGQSLNFGISCDDIRDAVALSRMQQTPMTPATVPVLIAKRSSGSPGSADPGEVIDVLPGGIRVVDIQGTERGKEMLAELKEVKLVLLAVPEGAGADVLEGLLKRYLVDAMAEVGVRTVLDEGPIMLLVAQVSGKRLDLVGHLYTPDLKSRPPRLARLWRSAGDMGELTDRMWQRKRLSGGVDDAVTEFFAELPKLIKEARQPDSVTSQGSGQ